VRMGEIIASVIHGKHKVLSDTGTTVYEVTEGRKGKLVNLVITNQSGIERVKIYDAASSAESGLRLDVIVGATDTVVLDRDDLVGVEEFYSGVFAACTTSGQVWLLAGVEEY